MSSIDRISVNRPDPDYSWEEERKRLLARRHQLDARASSRLVLPAIETQSRLLAKKSVDSRNRLKESADHRPAGSRNDDDAYSDAEDLNGLARDIASGAVTSTFEDTDPRSPRFLQRHADVKANTAGGQAQARKESTVWQPPPPAAACPQEEAAQLGEAIADESRTNGQSPALTEKDTLGNDAWLRRLDAAFATARNTGSVNSEHALEQMLDELLHEVQNRAVQSEPLTAELKAALDALSNKRMVDVGNSNGSDKLSPLQGSLHFLNAFVENMESKSVEERQAALAGEAKGEGSEDGLLSTTSSELVEERRKPFDLSKAEDKELVSPAQDRKTLFEYLELLSSAAVSSAPVALQQIAQGRLSSPEEALMRLAASGDQSVSLYLSELSRRLDVIDARIARDDRKSARMSMLAEAVDAEKEWLASVTASAESITSYAALARRSDNDEREKRLAETLPQLILQKT